MEIKLCFEIKIISRSHGYLHATHIVDLCNCTFCSVSNNYPLERRAESVVLRSMVQIRVPFHFPISSHGPKVDFLAHLHVESTHHLTTLNITGRKWSIVQTFYSCTSRPDVCQCLYEQTPMYISEVHQCTT